MSMTETEVARANELAAEGKTYKQIARALGVPPLEVYASIPDTGEDSSFAQMARLASHGLSNAQIAQRLGVTRQAVSKQLGPRERRGETVVRNMRMKPGTFDRMRELASDLGYLAGRGIDPHAGSIGRLLDAIAAGEVKIARSE